jgi:hypothetical protein
MAPRSADCRRLARCGRVAIVLQHGFERAADLGSNPTQKPAAHGCGRVSGETNHFDKNTMVDWTSQPEFEFLIHKGGLGEAVIRR